MSVFVTSYPDWYIMLCLAAGILAAMILYFRENKNEFPVWLKRLLGINRFVLVTLIAFLLLSPLLKKFSRNSEKPIIVFAQDNSQSITMGKDSAFFRVEYKKRINDVLSSLSTDYDLRLFTFGEDIRVLQQEQFDTLSFDQKLTDISALNEMMETRFTNRNVGALIIASDGIYNKGLNPAFMGSSSDYPIYTIALGDTLTRSDAFLKRVLYNRIAFEGNDFPVEIILNAHKLQGASLNLRLSENGREVASKMVLVPGDNYSGIHRFIVTAGDEGMHHYVLSVTSNKNEITTENNKYDLFVEVLQSKQKVLILANAPHPDITAIKAAISTNVNYDVSVFMLDEFRGGMEEYNLVILHQLPSFVPASRGVVNLIMREKIPALFILGSQTDLSSFNGLKTGLIINPYNQVGLNESQAVINEEFTLFMISENLKNLIPDLPPLNSRFARYSVSNASAILFYQRIGNVDSKDPLLVFQQGNEARNGVLCGTGIWRWRMKSWLETGNHDAFNELMNKSVQYLSLKDDKRRFRVETRENISENTSVIFNAELYNESFESNNEPDVELEVSDEEGNTYEFNFGRNEQFYSLNAGSFEVGTYTYKATTKLGNEVFYDEGGFTVLPLITEKLSLRARHELLELLSSSRGGAMLNVEHMEELPQLLNDREDIKPLIHTEKRFIEFIDIWWLLVIILALLGVEWFLRKWSGSY